MKIKKGDTVLIISGKDKGKKGKVFKVLLKENKILIEGVNLRKRHQKPKKSGEKGQIIVKPAPIDVSNAKIICSKCGKAARIGYKISEGKTTTLPPPQKKEIKVRICKKCGQEI